MDSRAVITCGAAGSDYPGFTHLAIQAAVEKAAQTGGEVLLSPGEYVLADSVHLQDHMVLRGSGIGQTILRKNASVKCTTEGFCGYGHKEILVTDGSLFRVGDGVYLTGDNAYGFQATQTTVTEVEGNTVFLADPLEADILKHRNGTIETIFPMIKGADCTDVIVRDMTLEGNAAQNGCLGGCRGGAIFLIGCRDICVEQVKITDFNGEGFSYQQCRNIRIQDSECSYNRGNGVHPGSGTVGMVIEGCELHHNERAGIFYCLRICYNLCRNNWIHHNELEGITIGHRDDHIEICGNEIWDNGREGIYFRPENYPGMSGRYVSVHHNRICDNVRSQGGAQIYAPASLTGFELYENELGGPVSFACEDRLYESCLWQNRPEGSCRIAGSEISPEELGERGEAPAAGVRRIDPDNIPEREYRHLN